ncbi:hypothetical protein MYX84_12560, partial [Acidobacteria bacterium AH-259-O06]|nr:hypothetical protein [Acidobacteria bacterium AH-259-O06]
SVEVSKRSDHLDRSLCLTLESLPEFFPPSFFLILPIILTTLAPVDMFLLWLLSFAGALIGFFILWKISWYLLVIAVILCALLSFGISVRWAPHNIISLEIESPLIPNDPFTARFKLTNQGPLNANEPYATCVFNEVVTKRGMRIQNVGVINTITRFSDVWIPGGQFTLICENTLVNSGITSANISIEIFFKSGWSVYEHFQYKLRAEREKSGQFRWTVESTTPQKYLWTITLPDHLEGRRLKLLSD